MAFRQNNAETRTITNEDEWVALFANPFCFQME